MDITGFRRGRALLGFMTEQDAINFLKGNCAIESENELEVYRKKWASAAKLAGDLKLRILSPLVQGEISQGYLSYTKEVLTQELFKRTFGENFALREVELERVISFQRHIDAEYSAELAAKMKTDDRFVLESCLPTKFHQNLEVTFDQAVPGVTFSSPSPKLLLAGIEVIGVGGPEVSLGGQLVQQPGALFLVGTQPNYVQVVEYRNRYFLKNGYHRAYAALLSGRRHIPAVVSVAEDFVGIGAINPGFFQRDLLMSDAPPLLPDFLNDGIAVDVKLRPMRKVVRARVDEFFVPR